MPEQATLCDVSHFLISAITQHMATVGDLAGTLPKHPASHHGVSVLPVDILLILVGVLIGRLWGRWAGIRHLGAAEFKSRWAAVRKVRRW